MQKLLSIILYSSFLILGANSIVAQSSRPPSEWCPFEADVLKFEDKTGEYEELELTLKIKSHTIVRSRLGDAEDLCDFLKDGATVSGKWNPWDNRRRQQPAVDKMKVLTKNSSIKGEMDSYDHQIEMVVLIGVGTSDKSTKENDAVLSSRRAIISLVAIFILIIGGIVNLFNRQRKT